MDTVEFEGIGQLDVKTAREKAKEIIKGSGCKKLTEGRLIRDIIMAPSAKEVERILWMCALSGEGLGSLDSNWKKVV